MKRLYIIARHLFYKLADLVTLGSGRSITFHGISIRIPFSLSHYYPGDYEKINFDFISTQNNMEGYCLDIGAHIGVYSIWLAKKKGSRVIAFEPTPSVYTILQKMISLNKLGAKIAARQVAIAGFSGTTLFHLHRPKKPGNERLRFAEANSMENYDHGGGSSGEKINVRCLTVDDFRKNEGGKVGFIKIDAEGSELAILQGSSGTFKLDRPSGIISIHTFMHTRKRDTLEEIYDFLYSHGMKVFYGAVPIGKPEFLKLDGLDIVDIQFSPRET